MVKNGHFAKVRGGADDCLLDPAASGGACPGAVSPCGDLFTVIHGRIYTHARLKPLLGRPTDMGEQGDGEYGQAAARGRCVE